MNLKIFIIKKLTKNMANLTTVIFDEQQPQIVYGILGDTYVYANERAIEVTEYPMAMGGDGDEMEAEPITTTKYEYDVRHFPLVNKTEEGVLEALKKQISDEIDAFDNGTYNQYGDKAVNDFTINGVHMWLDKETRNGLRFRFESQQALDQETTTLWYRTMPISLDIPTAITMLHNLEVYASGCFDRTASHKNTLMSLESINDVFNYDYTADYPEHLAF